MPLLLAILAAFSWFVFTAVSVQTLLWLTLASEADGKRRRAAMLALAALAGAIIFSVMRLIMNFT